MEEKKSHRDPLSRPCGAEREEVDICKCNNYDNIIHVRRLLDTKLVVTLTRPILKARLSRHVMGYP